MFEIDKEKFGAFVAEHRKARQLTQKELARKLFVSDKAVSKWERSQSLPDISLLIPLAEALGVTVTELLECRSIAPSARMDAGQVEELVKKTIHLSKEDGNRKRVFSKNRAAVFGLCLAVSLAEGLFLWYGGCLHAEMVSIYYTTEFLGVVFGAYFWLFALIRLPDYYDSHKISMYYDGAFRMNLPGLYLNNQNWPYVLRAVRLWAAAMLTAMPPVYGAACRLLADLPVSAWVTGSLAVILGSLFVPMYVAAKRHGSLA